MYLDCWLHHLNFLKDSDNIFFSVNIWTSSNVYLMEKCFKIILLKMRGISNNDVRFFWKYTGNKIRYGFYLWISNQIMFDWIFLGKNSAILSYIFLVILWFPIFAYRWRRQQQKKLCLLYWELYLFFSTFISVKRLGKFKVL